MERHPNRTAAAVLQRRRSETDRAATAGAATAFAGSRGTWHEAIEQSPRLHAQAALNASVHGSPTMVAQRVMLARALGDAAPRQLKAQRGSGWGWPGWQPGGKEAWTTIETHFDGAYMTLARQLTALAGTQAPLQPGHQLQLNAIVAGMRWDVTPIPYADGLELAKNLLGWVAAGPDLVSGITTHHSTELQAQKDQILPLKQPLVDWGQKMGGILSEVRKGAVEERKQLLAEVNVLLNSLETGQRCPGEKVANLLLKQADLIKHLGEAHAAAAQKKLVQQAELQQQELARQQEELEQQAQDEILKKLRAKVFGNNLLLQSLRAHASDTELLDLLGLMDAGSLNAVLPYAAPAKLKLLCAKTSVDHLKRLLPAIGKSAEDDLLQLLGHVGAGAEPTLVKMLELGTAGQAGRLLDVAKMFPAGTAGATDALALLTAAKKGQEALVLALLKRVGVGASNDLIACLEQAPADEVDFCLDPARGGHAIAELRADLTGGGKVWGGAAAGAVPYKKQNLAGAMEGATLADIQAHAFDTNHGAVMPAADGQSYCKRSFGNLGGADTMRLPRRHGGGALVYTEYDIRPYTSPGERGQQRVVIDNLGTVYYTTNHYQSFGRA